MIAEILFIVVYIVLITGFNIYRFNTTAYHHGVMEYSRDSYSGELRSKQYNKFYNKGYADMQSFKESLK